MACLVNYCFCTYPPYLFGRAASQKVSRLVRFKQHLNHPLHVATFKFEMHFFRQQLQAIGMIRINLTSFLTIIRQCIKTDKLPLYGIILTLIDSTQPREIVKHPPDQAQQHFLAR